mgnify:CR=1 FL=1
MIILMFRMMANGAIILDPAPKREPVGKYIFFRARTATKTNIWGAGSTIVYKKRVPGALCSGPSGDKIRMMPG